MTDIGPAVTAALGEKPSHGTVVRWQTRSGYTYMAMAIETRPGSLRWWSTATEGNPYVPQSMTSTRLLRILDDPETVSVGVTNDFEEVEVERDFPCSGRCKPSEGDVCGGPRCT